MPCERFAGAAKPRAWYAQPLLGWLAEPPVAPLVMAFTSALGGDASASPRP